MAFNDVRVVIFDVNGVLIDSNIANAEAMAMAFTDDPLLGAKIVERYLQLTGIDRGSKIHDIQKNIVLRPFDEGEFELRWQRFKKLSRETMSKAPIGAGSIEVLSELGKMGRVRVALSNTPEEELGEILRAQGLDQYLDIIRGGGRWPKSESLSRLLQEFAFEPDECFFIADGKGDLLAARMAAVPFAAIDPETGEFDGETGFAGPFQNLHEWWQKGAGLNL